MGNNLYKVEKDLRSIAKRYKSVKYSLGLAILFLMLGVSAFSEEVNSNVATREELQSSVGNVQTKLNVLRNENQESIKKLRLELIQLMEQGDQVIKSPWSSWQFGVNYFYDNWGKSYKGRGDKAEKYPFNGIYTRGNWQSRNAMNTLASARVGGTPLTPGRDSQNSWTNLGNISNGGVSIEKDTSIGSSTNGNRNWGLVNLENIKEPTNEVEILARISPKEVIKQPISLNITEPSVQTMEAPTINPQVNTPLNAPVIELPQIESVNISSLTIGAPEAPQAPQAPAINIGISAPDAPSAPTAPSVSVNPSAPRLPSIIVSPSAPGTVEAPTITINVTPPSISALSISTPSVVTAPTVVSPNITPVDFVIDPSGNAQDDYKLPSVVWNKNNTIPTVLNVTEGANRDYVTINNGVNNMIIPDTQTINVTKGNNRALVIDEVNQTRTITSKAKINLQAIKNVGIDLQGGHSGTATAPTVATIINAGTITGLARDPLTGADNKQHIAFGFNNADASNNTTMTHMINQNKIELNAPSSAAIQLKPEDPNYWGPASWDVTPLSINSRNPNSNLGRVLMKADNTGTVDINGSQSFGILTVFNEGVPASLMASKIYNYQIRNWTKYNAGLYNLKAEREFVSGTRILPGGEIGRSALSGAINEKYRSGIYNTGNINILGDESIAIGLLQEIQEVKIAGNINIGNQSIITQGNNANTKTSVSKVEEAVGVFAGVPTHPVKSGETDSMGNQNTTGSMIGTETVELNGNITLGIVAENSIGALVGDTSKDLNDGKQNGVNITNRKLQRSGDITAKSGSVINVGGNKNYGFVVNSSAHSSNFNANQVDDLIYSVDKVNHGRGINEGRINVTGTESIGFAMIKGGNSSNSGTITVGTNAENSIGFYGKEDEFSNTGTIEVTSAKDKNKAIVLDGTNSSNKIKFTNTGNVNVNKDSLGTGNIGVYAQGNYKLEHNSGTINAGSNAIALYVKDSTGEVNINAPIVLSASGTGVNKGTTIGIYSDGDAKVNFGTGSKLTIGQGAVGLYSSDAQKFANTFKVTTGKSLEVNLGTNSTLGLLNGTSGTVNVGTYLSDNTINTSSFGSGASIFYSTGGVKATLDKDYTVSNGSAASTAILVGANGSTVEVANGRILTTNTNVGLVATKGEETGAVSATATNAGTIISNRDSGIGIYTSESTGTSSGTITMQNKESVGILGENNSTLSNSGKIELGATESAGIYGKDSNITNSGTGANGIYVEDGKSAGIYGLLTSVANGAKTLNNTGLIKIENRTKSGSASIYAKLDSTATNKLSTQNSGTIEVEQTGSAGIYAENNSSQANAQSVVTNSGLVKMSGTNSVGIIGEKSQITNSGTGANGIEISGVGSAGILARKNSKVENSGRIEGKIVSDLVGISVDDTSTVENSGTITMENVSNTGIASTGGEVTNKGTIILNGQNSTGISSENANVTNSLTTGKIEVKNANSMGIYSKSDGSVDRTVTNNGEISLNTPIGISPSKSAAIYSLLDSGSSKLTTTNTATIKVDQNGSAGIYAKNESSQGSNQSDVRNTGDINVSKENSVGILGEKSSIVNVAVTGTITLSANKTAGIIGNNKSVVNNISKIITTGANPSNATDGLVGISVNDSTGTNETTGTISLGTAYSTGMYGEANSTLTNAGAITGDKQNAIGMAVNASTATNNSGATITLSGANSTGMFGENDGSTESRLTNSGTINGNGVGAVGIAVDKSTATNNSGATITLSGINSTGIFGKADSVVTNAGTIETKTAVPTNTSEGLVGIALNASTGINSGAINLGTAYSTGMFGKNDGSDKSRLTNRGTITGTQSNIVGMAATTSEATNNSGATISLEGKSSTGIFGEAESIVSNSGKIEMKTVSITTSTDGLVGIALNNSTGTNTSTGQIKIGTAYSTGMFGEVGSTLINEGIISGDKTNAVGMAGNNSTVTNKKDITLEAKNSTGMFGKANSTLSNETTGTITVKEEKSVGIYATLNSAIAANKGAIKTEKESSAGILGDSSHIENSGSVSIGGDKSAGMYAKNSNAINRGTITTDGHTSAGVLVELDANLGSEISGINETNGSITVNKEISAGMLGKVATTGNGSLTLTNKNNITVNSKSSAGMMVENNSTSVAKANVKAENTGTITLSTVMSDGKNIGILASKNSTGINAGTINVASKESVGMLGQNSSSITNNKTINLTGEQTIGMLAKDTGSTATNEDTITVTGKQSLGMLAQTLGDVKNNKTIRVNAESGVGIFVSDTGTGENTSTGTITLENKNAVGIFAKNNGNTYTAKNSGIINLNGNNESLIGMYAQAETGKNASVRNEASGIINVNTKSSVGIYANNTTANVSAVDLQNEGTINVNNEKSAGIYAPNANISKVGTIKLENSTATNGSSAVYVSNGGKVSDTASAIIDLGKVNQNRVAYYVNGLNSSLAGANIGKISGYGVGVYLQGGDSSAPTNIAKIDGNTPTLNYTTGNDNGNGIIGLFLNGNTDIQSYNKGITVGDTVAATSSSDKPKYAIGVYANAQGTSSTPYNITTPITAGKNGVGIYADKDSNIKYTGNMEIGDGTTAGTGIFITEKEGTTGGKVELGTNTIKLKGTGGVAVIASEGTTFDGKNATIELIGTNVQGVGVYAKKGSSVNVNNWTFNNHGNAAEEVRSEEGGAYITANKQLKPKMVLTHVINGETSVASGVTVTSVDDSPYKAEANIGLMAEGVKNPNAPAPLTWQEANFEAVNHGTIDFSNSERSTAIFINSARAKNDGTIKVGKNSTAIYGFYNKNTRKYDGATTNPNKLELETTANSNISLGESSTGMYLVNAEKINNIGGQITSESGATKNVGIYAINGQDSDSANNKTLTMTTATNITLGNGSVGLYSKGQSNTVRNTVTNTGNITVGDKITVSKTENYPAVAVYAENTNLNTNSNIAVGKDGIAFYGKNSTIDAKGNVNFSNKGVLAYLENSTFISHIGNLGATQNTMLYLKNSIAQLDGAGTKADIEVADGYTGAYIEGNSQLTGVKTIKLGENSTGIYLQNTTPNFVSRAESITGTKDKARGILGINSSFTNNSKISLSGAESVGIYSNADNSKTVVNNGELNLSGKQTLGVFLRGGQSFENKANINIADSADSKNPTIGIYTAEGTSNIKHTSGTIEVGEKSIGIYSKTNSNVEMNAGKIHVKDQAIGIYKENGKVVVKGELDIDKHTATTKDSEPTGVYAVNGAEVDDQASKITVGAKSYGFILNNTDSTKTNVYSSGNGGTVSLGDESVFLYSNGKANITNNRTVNANGSEHLIGFYIKNGGDFTNNGTIDFSTGKGNISVYAPAGKATNKGRILVGKTDDIDPATGKVYTDVSKIVYGIGMAADNGGHIVNENEIRVYNNKSIGMYGSGLGTTVENKGTINLDGSRATATDKIQSMTGVYVDEGATFRNFGTITTTDSYAGRDGKVNENVTGLTGVAIMNGSTLINEASGKILIDADNSSGVVIRGKKDATGRVIRYAVIKNYGEIKVRGKGTTAISWENVSQADIDELQRQINSRITSDPSGQEIGQASGTNKDFQGVTITVKDGKPVFTRNGVLIPDSEVQKITELLNPTVSNLGMSDVGFYVDTLGRTKPIDLNGANPPVNSQLIIGTEYSEKTNSKEWFVSGNVIKPFLDQIQGRNFKLTSLAGSLTWIATPVLDNNGQITGVAMSKLSYTSFVKPQDNAYNFADGLEQRYDMNALDSVEKRIFNKLNSIGKNEETLLTQAYDEMMGHQYANVQQRVQATGNILDKEFNHLRNSWTNPTKDSNKVKTFGMKGEYKTDTAGIIDYKYNAYGVAYVHENEDIKLGRGTGWYTGIVHNTFKFKDIGKSKEEQLQAKVGLFKSVPFDDNNSLNWTISGDIFVGHNKMHRKFLVVDEIFNAKSKYYTYGIGIKNELSKEFRLSESFSLIPYGALRVEYGRMTKIKEKSGEMKLEVKENDYFSVRPEIGTELAYKHYFGTKSLRTSVGVAYENELGRVANGKNKARVAGTTADWFNIRGEKEDRKGNVKFDLNVGLDNQRFGITGNVGYDTKGSNVRGGVGLRVIF